MVNNMKIKMKLQGHEKFALREGWLNKGLIKKVYDEIVKELTEKEQKKCEEIFARYSRPPYGMSEDIITLMIAVVCANLSYCLRFRYNGEVKNINNWKELVVIKDKKIDVDVIRKSTFIVVDAGEVVGKYKRLFTRIQDNRIMSEVFSLKKELEQMTMSDEIPEEIETEFLLAKNLLDTGSAAKREWDEVTSAIEDQYEEALENSSLYNALKALEALEDLQISKYFEDNGFDVDENTKQYLNDLRNGITKCIDDTIDGYIATEYCKDVEHMTSFRNHNNKMQKLLEELGFREYAMRVGAQKDRELENTTEIKSRQELRADCSKFLNDSKVEKFTTYVAIKEFLKRGIDLQERVSKYKNALGRDGDQVQSTLDERVKELDKIKNRIEQDITDIWDDLYDVKTSEDIEDLIERINLILQKGISYNDQVSLEEARLNLSDLYSDVERLNASEVSRTAFGTISTELIEKYKDAEFDFEVNELLDELIKSVSERLDEKEKAWVDSNLSLGDKSRENIHKWKDRIKFLPEYLSEKTIERIQELDVEADEVIKDGKIDDVLYYSEKLEQSEKEECMRKLQNLM